jgi:hypothetical protein
MYVHGRYRTYARERGGMLRMEAIVAHKCTLHGRVLLAQVVAAAYEL